jgi:trehalose 2-sulfotransferase
MVDRAPVRSYLICATQRSGSQFLCELLRSTRVAGWPAEYYLPRSEAERYRVDVPMDAAYLARILARRTSNGVFGMTVMRTNFAEFVEWVGQFRPDTAGRSAAQVLATVFPDLRYVHLTRRDRVRQAVSVIRWLHTRKANSERVARAPFDLPFSYQSMEEQIAGLRRQDEAWRRFFAESGVEPVRVVYEDLAERPAATVAALLRGLGIGLPDELRVGGTRLRRQADAINEAWVADYWRIHQARSAGQQVAR